MLRGLAKVVTVLLLGLLASGGWIAWNVHQVRGFCAEVHPGLPLAELGEIARRHGVALHWVAQRGIFDAESKDWVLFVPAEATMGDVSCAIHHDGAVVTGAKLWAL